MGMIMDSIAEWLKEILVGGIISNLSGMFDSVNGQVGEIAVQVGTTPQAWNGTIYSMIRTLSENVMVPIADVYKRQALGEDVYHYHLHVVYIPVVEKQILWSKRCKDCLLYTSKNIANSFPAMQTEYVHLDC